MQMNTKSKIGFVFQFNIVNKLKNEKRQGDFIRACDKKQNIITSVLDKPCNESVRPSPVLRDNQTIKRGKSMKIKKNFVLQDFYVRHK